MLLVNNTGVALGEFERAIREAVAAGAPLPESIADLFAVEVIDVGGERRIVVRWA